MGLAFGCGQGFIVNIMLMTETAERDPMVRQETRDPIEGWNLLEGSSYRGHTILEPSLQHTDF